MSAKLVEDWLARQCTAIPGVLSGIVALPVENSTDRLVIHWPRQDKPVNNLLLALKAVLQHQRPVIQAGSFKQGQNAQPSVVGAPMALAENVLGAASLTLVNTDDASMKKVLQHLRRGIRELQTLLEEEAGDRHTQQSLQAVTRLLATSLSTIGFAQSALAICNELSSLMRCDRVSIGSRENGNSHIVAISNSIEIKHKQQFVRTMVTVMDEAMDQQSTVTLMPGADNHDQITLAHRVFIRDTGDNRSLCTVPLMHDGNSIGAVLFERTGSMGFDARSIQFLENLGSFIAPVLHMKSRAEQPWTTRLLRALQRMLIDLRSGKSWLARSLLVLLACLLIVSSLPLLTWKISAPAQLEGAVQRSITAPVDGFIKRALAVPGEHVGENQVIAILDDEDLLLEKKGIEAELGKLQNNYRAALAKRDLTGLTSTRSEIEELEAKLGLVKQKLGRTQITAPFAGEIIEGDLTQSLGAPVRRGDVLMTLAPVNDYRVVLYASEGDIAHLQIGQQGQLALSALPSLRSDIKITRITPMASVREQKNVFEIEARLQSGADAVLRPGMEGMVKIEIEKRSLWWIGLRDIGAWLRLNLWKWTGLG